MAIDAMILETAMQWHEAGQLARAAQGYREILGRNPRHPAALHLLGLVAHQEGRHEEAVKLISQAIDSDNRQPLFFSNLGEAWRAQGEFEQAEDCYRLALKRDERFCPAHYNLALVLSSAGRPDEALSAIRRAIELEPNNPGAHDVLGNIHMALGDRAAAVDAYQAALAIRPAFPRSMMNLGVALLQLKRVAEAVEILRAAIELDASAPEIWHNLGLALSAQASLREAETCFREAIRLEPQYLGAQINLGKALQLQGKLVEARRELEAAWSVNPDHPETVNALGNNAYLEGRFREAIERFEYLLRRMPTDGAARHNRGCMLLLLGDWEHGWRECEGRTSLVPATHEFTEPLWDGSPAPGRTLLLHPEQGAGDTIQFIRYWPQVAARVGKVVVEVQRGLAPLLRISGVPNVIAHGEPLPQFDLQCRITSLPYLFEARLDNVPAEVPYLKADAALVAQWREPVRSLPGFRVGINWHGNPQYPFDAMRSIPLLAFAPLAAVPGVSLISLQRKSGLGELPSAREQFTIHDLGDEVDTHRGAFMDTAAIMQHLDLIITSDTSTAHLAGALGVPVWTALPAVPDWRWLLEREDCPWYPTMRLFRQRRMGDWGEVFRRMAEGLADLATRGT